MKYTTDELLKTVKTLTVISSSLTVRRVTTSYERLGVEYKTPEVSFEITTTSGQIGDLSRNDAITVVKSLSELLERE